MNRLLCTGVVAVPNNYKSGLEVVDMAILGGMN